MGVLANILLFLNKDLLEVFAKELNQDADHEREYWHVLRSLFLGPIQVLAEEIYEIVEVESSTAAEKLNDILCCLGPSEIKSLEAAYQAGTCLDFGAF